MAKLDTKGEILARITYLMALNKGAYRAQVLVNRARVLYESSREISLMITLFNLRLKKDHPSRAYYKSLLHDALGICQA